MRVTVEKQEGNKVHLEIAVESEGIKQDYHQAFSQYSQHLNVKGFRKGKIPPKLVEKYLDTDRIKTEIFQKAISESYQQALQQQQIDPIAEPEIQAVQTEVGKELIYKAVVEVRPTVVLGEYKDLTVTVPAEETVTDQLIDEQVDELRRKHAVLVPVDDRAAAMGDMVTLAVEGFLEGKPLHLGDTKEMTLEMKEGNFVEGFCEGVVGLKADQEKEIELSFPPDYILEELREKKVLFKVKINEIKEIELPDVDEDFARTVGEFDSLEVLKERIRDDLAEMLEEQHEVAKQQAILDKVTENAQVEIPASMVSREVYAMWQMNEGQQLYAAKASEGVMRASLNQWLQSEEAKESAGKRIKTTLVLGTIAAQEGLTVTQQEMDEEIEARAHSNGIDPHQLRHQLEQDGTMLALMDELLSIKIIDWLAESNTVQVEEADAEVAMDGEEAEAGEENAKTPKKAPAKKAAPAKKKKDAETKEDEPVAQATPVESEEVPQAAEAIPEDQGD